MFRTFDITIPADSNYHNVYSLIVGQASATNVGGYGVPQGGTNETGITGAIPTNGILTNLVSFLQIAVLSGVTTLLVSDRNNANTAGYVVVPANPFTLQSPTNSICIKDYLVKGSGLAFTLTLEAR